MVKLELFLGLLALHLCHGNVHRCDWEYQFLCGDKCVDIDDYCECGDEVFDFAQSGTWTCCNQDPCYERQGSVICNGLKQFWNQTCKGGCIQTSQNGYSTYLCNNQKECYMGLWSCNGIPYCSE